MKTRQSSSISATTCQIPQGYKVLEKKKTKKIKK